MATTLDDNPGKHGMYDSWRCPACNLLVLLDREFTTVTCPHCDTPMRGFRARFVDFA